MGLGSVDLILPGAELTCSKENQRCFLKVCAAELSPVCVGQVGDNSGAAGGLGWGCQGTAEPIRGSFVAWLSPGAEFAPAAHLCLLCVNFWLNKSFATPSAPISV